MSRRKNIQISGFSHSSPIRVASLIENILVSGVINGRDRVTGELPASRGALDCRPEGTGCRSSALATFHWVEWNRKAVADIGLPCDDSYKCVAGAALTNPAHGAEEKSCLLMARSFFVCGQRRRVAVQSTNAKIQPRTCKKASGSMNHPIGISIPTPRPLRKSHLGKERAVLP
jgi:hypothetical protein